MAEHTQEGRLLAINTPLGKDVLLLTGLSGREEMSRLFSFQLDLLSEKSDVAPTDVVGKNVTFTVYPGQDAARQCHGSALHRPSYYLKDSSAGFARNPEFCARKQQIQT